MFYLPLPDPSSKLELRRYRHPIANSFDADVRVLVPTGYRNPLCFGCADRIRGRIDASGLTRKDLAAMSGVSHSAICHVEDGNNFPRLSTIERIGECLGISPTWLSYGEEGTVRFRKRRAPSPVPYDPPETDPAPRPPMQCWRGVSQRLRRARTALGFTLRDIGEAAQVSPQGVLLIEKGVSDPMITTIEQLAVALDVSPGWLAFGEGEGLPIADAAQPSKGRS